MALFTSSQVKVELSLVRNAMVVKLSFILMSLFELSVVTIQFQFVEFNVEFILGPLRRKELNRIAEDELMTIDINHFRWIILLMSH